MYDLRLGQFGGLVRPSALRLWLLIELAPRDKNERIGRYETKRLVTFLSGAFHDRSTKFFQKSGHHIFNFDEIWSTGFSGALNSMVASADSKGQRFWRYSLGHFCKVTMQGNLWRPVAPKPLNFFKIRFYGHVHIELGNISGKFDFHKKNILFF